MSFRKKVIQRIKKKFLCFASSRNLRSCAENDNYRASIVKLDALCNDVILATENALFVKASPFHAFEMIYYLGVYCSLCC